MKLPTLFKRTKTGAIQSWAIETRGATMVTTHGQVGGALQETSDTIKVARSADTVEGQADAEAAAKHLGKRKKGYVDSIAAAESGAVGKEIEGGILPMLAYPYEKVSDQLVFPCYLQPKLDGHRCIAEPDGLWSRTRKPINSMPHIERAVEELGLMVDGELYRHDYKDKFEKLTSLIRKAEPAPGHEAVQLHVYDLPGPGRTFAQRHAAMEKLKPICTGTPIRIVETVLVNNEAEMWEAFERFLAQGYEGAIARNAAGLYENCRSVNLMKLKTFTDEEFKVVGMEEGRGKLTKHCGAFVCALPNGGTFNAKMVGPIADLKTAWENPSAWIGKQLVVKYQGLTAAGIPRFPVGLRLRNDL